MLALKLEVEEGLADERRLLYDAEIESTCKGVEVDWFEGTAGETTLSETGSDGANCGAEHRKTGLWLTHLPNS